MPIRALLAAAAVMLAAPVLAQETPATEPAPAVSAEQAAFEARAARFRAAMEQLSQEVEAVLAAGGGSETVLAAVDAILDRHRPEIDGFAGDLDAFLAHQAEQAGDPEATAQLTTAREAAVPVIRSIPEQVRAGVEQRLAQPAPGA